MKEDKYIQSLFETARSEEPQLSFEEASKTFEASLHPGVAASIKDWFLNHINLNSFIMMSTIGIIATVVLLNFQPEEKTEFATTPVIEEIPAAVTADSIVPVTVTVETQNEVVEISLKADPDKIRVTKTPIAEPIEISKELAITSIAPNKNEIDVIPPIIMNTLEEEPIEEIVETIEEPIVNKVEKSKKEGKTFDHRRRIPIQKRELSELEVVLETALNLDHLKENLFARNRRGEHHQLIMCSNKKFDHLVDIQFAGKKVIVVPNSHNEGFQIVGGEFADVLKFKLGEKKALLKFIYNSAIAEIELVKVDEIWHHKSTSTDHQQPDYILRSELLRKTFSHLRMEEIIERDKDGNFKPFALLSNGYFSPRVEVTFDGKELKVAPNKYNQNYDRKIPHVTFTKFQIKRRKANIQFSYEGNLVETNFRKKNGNWLLKSFIHNHGDNTYKQVNF